LSTFPLTHTHTHTRTHTHPHTPLTHRQDAFYEFRARVKELDRRLSSIVIQGFDDLGKHAMLNQFRLLESFDTLLLRWVGGACFVCVPPGLRS
jgi:hypothetical protein